MLLSFFVWRPWQNGKWQILIIRRMWPTLGMHHRISTNHIDLASLLVIPEWCLKINNSSKAISFTGNAWIILLLCFQYCCYTFISPAFSYLHVCMSVFHIIPANHLQHSFIFDIMEPHCHFILNTKGIVNGQYHRNVNTKHVTQTRSWDCDQMSSSLPQKLYAIINSQQTTGYCSYARVMVWLNVTCHFRHWGQML